MQILSYFKKLIKTDRFRKNDMNLYNNIEKKEDNIIQKDFEKTDDIKRKILILTKLNKLLDAE